MIKTDRTKILNQEIIDIFGLLPNSQSIGKRMMKYGCTMIKISTFIKKYKDKKELDKYSNLVKLFKKIYLSLNNEIDILEIEYEEVKRLEQIKNN